MTDNVTPFRPAEPPTAPRVMQTITYYHATSGELQTFTAEGTIFFSEAIVGITDQSYTPIFAIPLSRFAQSLAEVIEEEETVDPTTLN